MKKVLMLLVILVSVSFFNAFAEKPENLICPKSKNVMNVSAEKDKESLIKALEILIPEVYGSSPGTLI
ncbi:hypothetical protein ACFOU2_16425 [Bacillus songklensis]|uniref:Uncharacterized protein n=1 Tax=Bacillus songklensis TaxID=1069116 RepID=A0ABV8B3S6_9BACI